MRKILLLTTCFLVSFLSFGQCPTMNVTLTTQTEVDNFAIQYPNCTNFPALTLSIESAAGSDPITNLDGLGLIETLTGGLRIQNNATLTVLSGLENMEMLPGSGLSIYSNPLLTGFTNFLSPVSDDIIINIADNPNLLSLEGLPPFTKLKTLRISDTGITSMDGMEFLREVPILRLEDNTSLTSLDALQDIEIIGGNFTQVNLEGLPITTIGTWLTSADNTTALSIRNNENLISLVGLEVVQELRTLSISFNDALADVSSLGNLQLVEDNIAIVNNASIVTLSVLDDLTFNPSGEFGNLSIGDNLILIDLPAFSTAPFTVATLSIYDNPELISLAGLEGITEATTGLYIYRNHTISNLNPLSSIQNIGGDIRILENNNLINIDALIGVSSISPIITDIDPGIFIEDNPVLQNVDGLSNITSVPEDHIISIKNNASITHLQGIANLNLSDLSSEGVLEISNNVNLTTCDVQSICELLDHQSPATIIIEGNAYGCETVSQVNSVCLGCPIEDVVLTSQAEVVAFTTTYPDCLRPRVRLTISGADITDLSPLDGYVLDNVVIKDNPLLTSLTGITGSSGLWIMIDNNDALTDFTGLGNSAFNADRFEVINNDGLISFTGLEANVNGPFNSIVVGNNSQLRNIDGLENYTLWIGQGEILIYDNPLLENIDGLSEVSEILDPNTISITNNASLINIMGLSNLPDYFGEIIITDNASLSNCSIQSFCEFLDVNPGTGATISNNDEGCNTRIEVETNCTGCPANNITLSSQAEVDDFPVNYPGCQILNFDLTVSGNDITDLSALSQINTMTSRLRVLNNANLTSLNGLGAIDFQSNNGSIELENNAVLSSVGGFTPSSLNTIAVTIRDNPQLGSISTFSGITSLGFLEIDNNDSLTNLSGLDNVQDCDVLFLTENELLENIASLGNVVGFASNIGIVGNPSLTSLVGLEGYTDLGIDLEIFNNDALLSLDGLQGLNNQNSQANSVFYVVSNNELLSDISALESIDIDSLLDIEINDNPNLSVCANLSICEYLLNGGSAIIQNNAPGCNSTVEVLASCNAAFNRIAGVIQYDFNMDGCDVNDIDAPNILIETTDGVQTYGTYANASGMYQQFVPFEGTVNTAINTASLPTFFEASPLNQETVFTGFGNEAIIDFCLTATQTINDLKIALLPTSPARPGFDATYDLVYENVGTTQLSGEVTFYFDDLKQTFIEAVPSESGIVGGEVNWVFVDLNPFESGLISIRLNTLPPPTNEIGDTLNFIAEISPVTDDANPDDNSIEIGQVVVGAFDPNDKNVMQGPEIDEAEVGNYLDYVVRFQNTGNANATKVVIEDLLDDNLQWESLRPLNASHTYRTEIINGNELSFIFENIDLPPEMTDPEGSQGYIAFQVRTDDTLVLGDEVSNTASIFFDFNPAIITNTVTTVVGDQVAPIAICQSITIVLDASGQATITANDIDNGSSDTNGIATLELDITTFDCSNLGENTVTLTVTDTFGNVNECTAMVTVIDDMAPQLACQSIVVSLDENGEAIIDPMLLLDMTNSSDNCGIETVSASVGSVDCNAIDTPVAVTVTAQDASGNSATCTTTISALDELPPVFDTTTLPVDQTKLTDESGVYLLEDFTSGILADDNCTATVTLSQSPEVGTSLAPGVYDITISATDAFSNETEYSFELTVELLLGLNEFSIENEIILYPNPVSDMLQIKTSKGIELKEVTIYSIQGKKLLVTSAATIDVSLFTKGVYLVAIVTEKGDIIKKMIKN